MKEQFLAQLGASGRSPTKRLSMVKRPARARGRRLSLQLVWFGSARIDRCWVVRTAGWVERLSGGKEGFDGFVSEDDQRGHRPEAGRERLVAAGVADAANDLFAAEFLQIISGVAGAVL